VLFRELYRGHVILNKTQKHRRRSDGKKYPATRPAESWLTREASELWIVPEELWAAAHDESLRGDCHDTPVSCISVNRLSDSILRGRDHTRLVRQRQQQGS
jgi:hypothetical protein